MEGEKEERPGAKRVFVVLAAVALHFDKENLFVEWIDGYDVDFIFPLAVPPGADFVEIAAFPQLFLEIAFEHVPADKIGERLIDAFQKSTCFAEFDERTVGIDVTEPKE